VSRGDLKKDSRLFDSEGTPCFTAPECHIVEKDGYEPMPTDIWSIGVCLFAYCSEGKLPFYGESELEIQIASRQKELELPESFSAELKEALKVMLNKDPSKRPTAE